MKILPLPSSSLMSISFPAWKTSQPVLTKFWMRFGVSSSVKPTLLATRLHKAIASLKLFHPQSPTGRYATVSIGHSTYAPEPNDCYGVLDMLATVIKFVRDAKHEGGNQSKSRLHSRVLK